MLLFPEIDSCDISTYIIHVDGLDDTADYWKSQVRKFCDFCKCWIADNKPSIEFHEGGKKHKENVSKRLREIHKNSAKQAKINKKFENDIKTMENAAMAAYLKDVEGNTVDLTAKQILRDKHKKNDLTPTNVNENPNRIPMSGPETNPRHKQSQYLPADVDYCDPTTFYRARACPLPRNGNALHISSDNKSKGKATRERRKGKRGHDDDSSNKKSISKLWYEARSPEGYIYYWHVETNETSWEPPKEGFMTFAEQEDEAKEQMIQAEFLEQIEQEEAKTKAEILEEQRANAERERLKELRKEYNKRNCDSIEENREEINADEKTETETKIPYRRDYSIPEKVDPYGPWQTVEIKSNKTIDLQLPKKEVIQVAQPVITEPFVPQRTFTEKTITTISTGDSDDETTSTTFKKRKFGNRNTRKRFDDD